MTTTSQRLLFALAVSLGLGAAFLATELGIDRSEPVRRSVSSPLSTSLASRRATTAVRNAVKTWPGPYSAPIGRRLSLRTRVATSCVLAKQSAAEPGQMLGMEAQGTLIVTVLARRATELICAWEWRDLAVNAVAGTEALPGDAMRADLGHRVLVHAECTGEVLGVSIPSMVSTTGRNYWRALIAASRFIIADDGAMRWQREEPDPTGMASVTYVREPATEAGTEIRRECTSYRAVGQPLASVLARGIATFADDAGWYRHAQHDAKVVVEIADMKTRIEATQTVGFELVHVDDVAPESLPPADWDQAFADLGGADDTARAGADTSRRQVARQLAGANVASVIADLRNAVRALGADAEEAIGLRRQLIDLLRLQPEAALELTAALAQPDLEPALVGYLLSAAGAAGTPAAQQVCADFASQPVRPDASRMAALHALFQTDAPTPRTLDAVLTLASDAGEPLPVAGTAMLLLGAYANRNAGVQSADVVEFEQLARERGMLHDWFAALGNAGGEAVVDAVWHHLTAQAPDVRASALGALRRVQHVRAEQALLASLDYDADPRVRRTAAEHLAERGSDAALTALERLLPAADKGMREAMRRGLQGAESARARTLLSKLGA